VEAEFRGIRVNSVDTSLPKLLYEKPYKIGLNRPPAARAQLEKPQQNAYPFAFIWGFLRVFKGKSSEK